MNTQMKKTALLLLLGAWLVIGSGCFGEKTSNVAALTAPNTSSTPTAATDKASTGDATTSPPSVENSPTESAPAPEALSPDSYIQTLDSDVQVEKEPAKFPVQVPANWEVKQGEYPVGLYWQLMNRYAADAGFDLTALKGAAVEAWRYSLKNGLPGEGEQSEFTYPSNLLLLVQNNKVVGAWMEFNGTTIAGPSVHNHSLETLTGKTLDEWVEEEGFLNDAGKNDDLAAMQPSELITAYYAAVQSGDETRAQACLTPSVLMQSLSMNIGPNQLYHSGFNDRNTLHSGIDAVKVLSFQYLDPEQNKFVDLRIDQEAARFAGLRELMIEPMLDLTVSPDYQAMNSGKQPRFITMKKLATGWKIASVGTGP